MIERLLFIALTIGDAWQRLTYPIRRELARYNGEPDVPDTYDEAIAQCLGTATGQE